MSTTGPGVMDGTGAVGAVGAAGSVGAAAFGDLVRRIGAAARAAGLAVPAFRSPPRAPEATRTIRRLPAGAVVAVRIGARPEAAVAGDLVDGVIGKV